MDDVEYEAPFTIADVAALLAIRILSGGTADVFGVECPFCGDTRGKCNFCVRKDGELKNVYHCYQCGAAGNMLTLYADLTGLYGANRYKDAYWQIKEQLFTGTYPKKMLRKKAAAQIHQKELPPKEQRIDPEKLDAVYREMLTLLKLKERHKADLKRRGVSESEIRQMEEIGYRSTESTDAKRIARVLLNRGFSLKGVPGFFIDRNGDWEAAFYPANAGYLCPVFSFNGKMEGFQIRLDNPHQKRKYIWFTSSGLEGGASSKSPAGLSGKVTNGTIRVTEGILKAQIAYQCSGFSYIGNPGVSNHKGLQQMLAKLKEQGLHTVYECYDMDKMLVLDCKEDYDKNCKECEWNRTGIKMECPRKRQKRDAIRQGCIKLYDICKELDLSCIRVTWDTNEDGLWNGTYKGIDDWLLKDRMEIYSVGRKKGI